MAHQEVRRTSSRRKGACRICSSRGDSKKVSIVICVRCKSRVCKTHASKKARSKTQTDLVGRMCDTCVAKRQAGKQAKTTTIRKDRTRQKVVEAPKVERSPYDSDNSTDESEEVLSCVYTDDESEAAAQTYRKQPSRRKQRNNRPSLLSSVASVKKALNGAKKIGGDVMSRRSFRNKKNGATITSDSTSIEKKRQEATEIITELQALNAKQQKLERKLLKVEAYLETASVPQKSLPKTNVYSSEEEEEEEEDNYRRSSFASKLEKLSSAQLNQIGQRSLRHSDYNSAAEAFRLVLKRDEENYLSWYNLAQALVGLEHFDEAIAACEMSLSIRESSEVYDLCEEIAQETGKHSLVEQLQMTHRRENAKKNIAKLRTKMKGVTALSKKKKPKKTGYFGGRPLFTSPAFKAPAFEGLRKYINM